MHVEMWKRMESLVLERKKQGQRKCAGLILYPTGQYKEEAQRERDNDAGCNKKGYRGRNDMESLFPLVVRGEAGPGWRELENKRHTSFLCSEE